MNLLRNFGKTCFDAFQSFSNEIQKEFESTNWEKFEKEFIEMSNAFKEKLSNFKMKVKEQAEKFYIEVPFDINTQILTYELRPNLITVTVKNDETETSFLEERKYERSIPSSFSGCTITEKYLKDEKVMLFICTKPMSQISEENNETENTEDVSCQDRENTSTIEDTLVIDESTNLNSSVDTTASTITLEEMEEAAEEAIAREDAINDRIYNLYQEGWSYRKIGREVGLSDKTVARRLKKMAMG